MLKTFITSVFLLIFGLFAENSSPLEGFNVVVKDLNVAGKTVRVSPFAGVGVVTINFCFKNAGEKLSPKGKEALVALLARSLGEATESKTREQLQDYCREHNVSVGFASDDDDFCISGKCPTNKLPELFNLIKEMLFQAKFNEADIRRFKDKMAASLMQAMQSPCSQLGDLVNEIIYKDHPYGTSNKAYLASLKHIGPADLKAYMKTYLTQENLIIAACGEFEEAQLLEQLEVLIKALPKNFKAILPNNIEVAGPYKTYSKTFPVPQTVLSFWHKGIDIHHPDFFALQVAGNCLSAPDVGLLTKKIRTEKGLTYGIGARFITKEHFKGAVISTSTQTENVDKLIEAVRELLSDVRKNGFSAELVKDAQQSFIESYKLSFSSSCAIAAKLIKHQIDGRSVDFHKEVIEKIAALTPEQVNEAFKKFINPDQIMIFKVGK